MSKMVILESEKYRNKKVMIFGVVSPKSVEMVDPLVFYGL